MPAKDDKVAVSAVNLKQGERVAAEITNPDDATAATQQKIAQPDERVLAARAIARWEGEGGLVQMPPRRS